MSTLLRLLAIVGATVGLSLVLVTFVDGGGVSLLPGATGVGEGVGRGGFERGGDQRGVDPGAPPTSDGAIRPDGGGRGFGHDGGRGGELDRGEAGDGRGWSELASAAFRMLLITGVVVVLGVLWRALGRRRRRPNGPAAA